MSELDVFGKLVDLKPGESLVFSQDDAWTFFNWGRERPRTPDEVQGAIWRHNIFLAQRWDLHGLVATKRTKPAGPSPFASMSIDEFKWRQDYWYRNGRYPD